MIGFSAYRQSHFAPAFFFLSSTRRRALQILYEVCRVIDDAVDEQEKYPALELAAWEHFFHDQDPNALRPFGHETLAKEFLKVANEFGIPWGAMMDLIKKGVGVDLEKSCFQTPMETESYCYGVAGTVGVACLPIFGVPVEEARAYAGRLGIGIQWVNLIRDVGVDARMGRIYFPLDHLEQFQCLVEDVLARKKTSAFDNLIRFEAEVARSHFRRARELFPIKWEQALKPARIMGTIYSDLLLKIERNSFPVLDVKIRLNLLEKAVATIKAVTQRN